MLPIPEDKMAELTDALLQNRKIQAIKIYREFTGMGLKESKDDIDRLEASLRKQFPDKFASPPQGKGCLGATAVFCIGTAALSYWLVRH
jgi:hypothetical protein